MVRVAMTLAAILVGVVLQMDSAEGQIRGQIRVPVRLDPGLPNAHPKTRLTRTFGNEYRLAWLPVSVTSESPQSLRNSSYQYSLFPFEETSRGSWTTSLQRTNCPPCKARSRRPLRRISPIQSGSRSLPDMLPHEGNRSFSNLKHPVLSPFFLYTGNTYRNCRERSNVGIHDQEAGRRLRELWRPASMTSAFLIQLPMNKHSLTTTVHDFCHSFDPNR